MTVLMWRITTNKEGRKQVQKEQQDIKQENVRKTSTTCRMPTNCVNTDIGEQDNTQEGQVKVNEFQGILPWDGAQT